MRRQNILTKSSQGRDLQGTAERARRVQEPAEPTSSLRWQPHLEDRSPSAGGLRQPDFRGSLSSDDELASHSLQQALGWSPQHPSHYPHGHPGGGLIVPIRWLRLELHWASFSAPPNPSLAAGEGAWAGQFRHLQFSTEKANREPQVTLVRLLGQKALPLIANPWLSIVNGSRQ